MSSRAVLAATLIVLGLLSADARAAAELSYSDLRTAIAHRTVESATLRPADFEADVVLDDGAERTVGYPPTDEALADELAAAGATVEVDTDFARGGSRSRGPG